MGSSAASREIPWWAVWVCCASASVPVMADRAWVLGPSLAALLWPLTAPLFALPWIHLLVPTVMMVAWLAMRRPPRTARALLALWLIPAVVAELRYFPEDLSFRARAAQDPQREHTEDRGWPADPQLWLWAPQGEEPFVMD